MKESDKELLELAAKAAGIVILRSRLDNPICQDMLLADKTDDGHAIGWNPLEDDGDALRVARAVGMTIYFDSENQFCTMEHGAINGTCAFWGEYGDHSNMREAITWLAAQIGKSMP